MRATFGIPGASSLVSEILLAFVDYENLRMGFRNYMEFITVRDIIRAVETLVVSSGI